MDQNKNNNEEQEVPPADAAEDMVEPENIESLKKILAEEKAKAEKYLANWQRSQADFMNYKKRCEQEKEESKQFSNASLILSLLPVVDDFERAMASIKPTEASARWLEGINLILRKLQTILESQGLSELKTMGEPFDPRLSEAVMRAPGKEGIVITEIQKGYKLKDRVIRPSLVVVGTGEEEQDSSKENID